MKYKIALITVYFGKFPNYFHLWLRSAAWNSQVDFIIVTDNKIHSLYDNIKVVYSNLDEIKFRADKVLKMNCVLPNPYKLCDYKPAYGLIFSDLLDGYDFWGHCDIDIIWGDLRKFITDDLLDKYNRLFNLGHLTLYKNDLKTNRIFKKLITGVHYTYREAFSLDYNIGFDEKGCLAALGKNGNYRQYDDSQIIADIWPDTKRFRTFYTLTSDYDHIYSYEKGKVLGHFIAGGQILIKEFIYIHLQKRKMECCNVTQDKYLIVPDKFVDYQKITLELIRRYSLDRSPIITVAEIEKRSTPVLVAIMRKIRRTLFAHILKIDQL